ncbi:hypothetical protein A2468_05895 [Candidatus Falkowbacteria bacterium RIFOXYC2_FULL_46_15]|uniref:Uncharacterized protein n=1 Tax=Candidatus Falkowbacteria bacterium RIFOXYA2_FULL_47_19 TaxID=1797994 RepID=A0A1F5SGT9_9BACT|nr:MAG: hypothetical protein A2227_00380 [Candidatus Falkowbacteria bacterium RIFOXYA2_FULL_47_19]OGF35541.1 MAG: hypothetical protein A2468_05895 [Candidatus Falkowbacteria bacterium RIFOXYC2_FULL_46_15]
MKKNVLLVTLVILFCFIFVTNALAVDVVVTQKFYAGSGDGHMYAYSSSWDAAHDASAAYQLWYTATSIGVFSTKNIYGQFAPYRAFLPFDTSSIPNDAEIASAELHLYILNAPNDCNDGYDWITVVETFQASTSSLSNDDFDLCGDAINNPTEGIDSGERKDITNTPTNQYSHFSLNNTGKSWINVSGYTKLGLREGHDAIDSTPSLPSPGDNGIAFYSSEGSNPPYLLITYVCDSCDIPDSEDVVSVSLY